MPLDVVDRDSHIRRLGQVEGYPRLGVEGVGVVRQEDAHRRDARDESRWRRPNGHGHVERELPPHSVVSRYVHGEGDTRADALAQIHEETDGGSRLAGRPGRVCRHGICEGDVRVGSAEGDLHVLVLSRK